MDYQKYTDDIIALVVVVGTFGSYYVSGVEVPNEPMMFVLGYFFGKRLSSALDLKTVKLGGGNN